MPSLRLGPATGGFSLACPSGREPATFGCIFHLGVSCAGEVACTGSAPLPEAHQLPGLAPLLPVRLPRAPLRNSAFSEQRWSTAREERSLSRSVAPRPKQISQWEDEKAPLTGAKASGAVTCSVEP